MAANLRRRANVLKTLSHHEEHEAHEVRKETHNFLLVSSYYYGSAARANFPTHEHFGFGYSLAKAPSSPSRDNIFLCAFAPLRELLRDWVAALPRWDFVSFVVKLSVFQFCALVAAMPH
jgi:hypothetical protein